MPLLLAITTGFASGVFFRSLFIFSWEPIAFTLVLAMLFASARMRVPRRAYSLAALFCIFVAIGMLRAAIADAPLPPGFASDLRHRVAYDGVVVSDPDLRDASERVEVRVKEGHDATVVLAVVPRSTTVAVGDRAHLTGTLLVPQPFDDNGRTFRYDKYLERDGVRFLIEYGSIHVTTSAPWYSIGALLARVKHVFIDGLNATLPEPVSSLAGGIVIGGKSGLGAELENAFTKSGLIQTNVLSGYNVMVVAEWVMTLIARTRLKKWWGAIAGAFAVLLFVGIAGFTATAVRAMLMAMIALYARATGRSYAAGRALLVVVFLMLLLNPLYLAFDPGFSLSVTATAGLIYLAPIIEHLLSEWQVVRLRGVCQVQRRPPTPSGVGGSSETLRADALPATSFWQNTIATTLAAQIAVLPLLLYFTGNLSLVAVPANIIIAPIVPLAMALSVFAGFAGIIFSHLAPVVGIALALPAYVINSLIIFIATNAASLPAAAFTIPAFPFFFVLLAYAAIIFVASSKRLSTTDQFTFAKNAST